MNTATSTARRPADEHSSIDLRRVAACVFAAAPIEEDELRDLAAYAEDAADPDLAFFLIAWSAEKVAAARIAAGDLGIDEVMERIAGRRDGSDMVPSDDWCAAVAEYQTLADEILIDTLNEFREFDLVRIYAGRRDEYARRWAAGMQALARLHPELAGNSRPFAPSGRAASTDTLSPLALAV